MLIITISDSRPVVHVSYSYTCDPGGRFSTINFLSLFMKSVKRVFKKRLPRFNLQFRVARDSTPKK